MASRRQFLGWLAGVIPAAGLVRQAHASSMAHLNAAPDTLDALGLAILPSELGDAQIGRVVSSFRRWLDGYRENAEALHGYGSSRLTFTGPTPATRWAAQLDSLDATAKSTHGRPFAALSIDQRRAAVRELLGGERGTGMPSPERASHVAAGLLGFFYASPLATDLCYDAAIGRNGCRPLAESSTRPRSRSRSSGAGTLPLLGGFEGGS